MMDTLSDGVLDLHLLHDEGQAEDDMLLEYEGEEEEGEEQDGDMLAKLLARAERMREGISDPDSNGGILKEEEEEEGLLLDDMDEWGADEAIEEDRR